MLVRYMDVNFLLMSLEFTNNKIVVVIIFSLQVDSVFDVTNQNTGTRIQQSV